MFSIPPLATEAAELLSDTGSMCGEGASYLLVSTCNPCCFFWFQRVRARVNTNQPECLLSCMYTVHEGIFHVKWKMEIGFDY